MPDSSASHEDLATFVTAARGAREHLQTKFTELRNLYNNFDSQGYGADSATVDARGMLGDFQIVQDRNAADEVFVDTVRAAFAEIEGRTLPDDAIAKALVAKGVDTAPRQPATVHDPIVMGQPISSGFAQDPVCTATGHFVEPEDDFVMPATLGALVWRRTYNSQFIVPGPLGRGWASWATAHLARAGDEAEYHGPDGQVAIFLARDDAFRPNAGVEASVRADPDGDGLVLRWRWRSRFPGQRWRFAPDGRLLELDDPRGGRTSCRYDDEGRLVEMAHAGGRALTIEWDGALIVAVVASDGRRVDYEYDGTRNDLVAVRRPSGAMRYVSDAQGRITELFDADGVRLARNEYDVQGRVVVQESPFGRLTHFRYLSPFTTVITDDDHGPANVFRHDALGRLTELVTGEGTRLVRRFDDAGNPVHVVDLAGRTTTRAYDERNNCTEEAGPGGATWHWTYDDADRVVTSRDPMGAELSFSYEGSAFVPSRIDGPLGWSQSFSVVDGRVVGVADADGVGVQFELDADGAIVAVIDGLGHRVRIERHASGVEHTVTLPTGERYVAEVDGAGRLTALVTAAGDRISADRSVAGRVIATDEPGGGHVALRYGIHGELETIVDPLGHRTELIYDTLGDLVQVEWPGDARWQIGYDRMGQATTFVDPTGAEWHQHWSPEAEFLGITDPLGHGPRRDIDIAGRTTTEISAAGDRRAVRWGAAGRVVAESSDGAEWAYERDLLGRITSVTDPVGRSTIHEYTPAGRVRAVRTPEGMRWTYRYDGGGRRVAVVDPDGREWVTEFDASGRVNAQVAPTGERTTITWGPDGRVSSTEVGGAVTRYRYDHRGQVTAVVAGDGGERGFTYDAGGRLEAVTDPLGATTRLQRDERGAVVGVVDPKGATWRTEVDLLGRPVAVVDPLGRRSVLALDRAGRVVSVTAPSGAQLRFGRDADGRLVRTVGPDGAEVSTTVDRPTRYSVVTDAAGTHTEEWTDDLGRPLRRVVDGRTTTWAYDDKARRVTIKLPGAAPVAVAYDERSRPALVAHPVAGEVALERDPAGRVTALHSGVVERRWAYESGRLISYVERTADASSTTRLEYDLAGRVVVEEVDGDSWRYGHDRAGQLVSCDGPDGSWRWTYDACGRLTDETGPDEVRAFFYDEADQLVRIESNGETTELRYDDLGRRVSEHGPCGMVRYRWDGLGRLAGVERAGGSSTDRSVDLDVSGSGSLAAVSGSPIDWAGRAGGRPAALGGATVLEVAGSPVALVDGDDVEWLSCDWRGSVRGRAGFPARRAVSPWGPIGGAGVGSGASEPAGATLGFLGEIEFNGLVWLRNRVYDPATRSFLSRDPLSGIPGFPGALTNPYTYAHNDPLSWVDPSGLRPISREDYEKIRDAERAGHMGEVAGWIVVAGLVVACGALIVFSGGSAVMLFAGAGGLTAMAGSTANQTAAGKGMQPWSIARDGTVGMASGALFGWGSGYAAGLFGSGAGAQVAGGVLAGGTIGGGGSIGSQLATTGEVNFNDVFIDAAVGGFSGAVPEIKTTPLIRELGIAPGRDLAMVNGVIQTTVGGVANLSGGAAKGMATPTGGTVPRFGPVDPVEIEVLRREPWLSPAHDAPPTPPVMRSTGPPC